MLVNEQFFEKYNKPGPRYTSYPPATSFNKEFTKENFILSLVNSNTEKPENISIYIHIPFCPQRCYFCGCNTSANEGVEKTILYIDALLKEIDSVSKYIKQERKVTQIHWGGGTPNSISFDLIKRVMLKLRAVFNISDQCEIAMECNPAYLEMEEIDQLADMGFNRMSLGIQDFNLNVLKAINRLASKHSVKSLIQHMKEKGFKGVNIDLVYGLPLQTVESFKKTIEKVIEIAPDRLVTFSYAHVPWFNNLQKKLEVFLLPSPEEKLSMLIQSMDELTKNGYLSVGMDHYAKPHDELALALNEKKLHRNFQGYCTRETTGQVYAFGSSAISQLWGSYSQNVKTVDVYIEMINTTGSALERGYMLNREEKIRREVINEIMCNGILDFKEIADRFQTDADTIRLAVDYQPEKLKEFEEDNLLTTDGNTIQVSPEGMLVVRNIAMAFDPMLKDGNGGFSKTI